MFIACLHAERDEFGGLTGSVTVDIHDSVVDSDYALTVRIDDPDEYIEGALQVSGEPPESVLAFARDNAEVREFAESCLADKLADDALESAEDAAERECEARASHRSMPC